MKKKGMNRRSLRSVNDDNAKRHPVSIGGVKPSWIHPRSEARKV